MYSAWTVMYKPRSLSEVVGNRKAIRKVVDWVKLWDRVIPKTRAAFLYGPSGVGKTLCVEALANDLSMELVQKNASDYRTAGAIRRFAGFASQYATFSGKKRLVLLDELDGITGAADRGGIGAVLEIVKTAQCPIVLVANNAYDPRYASLRHRCFLIEFRKLPVLEVAKHLKRNCLREDIEASDNALRFIAQRSSGDVRSAVNDLQALAQGRKRLTYEDVAWLAHRDRKEVIFQVLRSIFYSGSCMEAKKAMNMADVDPDMLFEWIYENVPYHFTDPRDLARAMNALAEADLYRGRIRSTMDWKLTRYVVDFMTEGVAMAREGARATSWVPFRFSERIRMLSRTKRERQMRLLIGMKAKRKCHISAVRAVKEVLPYLRVIFENNADMAAGIAKRLDLDKTMIDYLAGGGRRAREVIKSYGG